MANTNIVKLNYTADEINEKLGKVNDPVQETGDSETAIMSQKAVTDYVTDYIKKVATKNLFNVTFENANLNTNGFHELDTGYGYAATRDYIKVVGGESYTFSYVSFSTPNVSLYVYEYDSDKTYVKHTNLGGVYKSPRTITVDSNCVYLRIMFRTSTAEIPWTDVVPNNIQIELGAEATEYVAPSCISPNEIDYSPTVEMLNTKIVQNTGESKEVIMSQKEVTDIAKRVGGINLFNGAYEIGYLSEEDGSLITDDGYYCTEFIPVKQGYYYYDASGGFVSDLGFGATTICFYDENKNFIQRTNYSRTLATYPNGTIYTSKFKAPSDGFVRYQMSSSKFDKLFFFESTETITTIYEMPDFSFSLQARLGSIENKISDLSDEVSAVSGIDAFGRNENALHNLNAASKYGYHKDGKQNQEKRFTALITTDVHSDNDRLKNAIEILNKAPSIDCGFCLGDIQGSNFAENDGSWYTNIVNASEKPFYTILGNHDQKNYSANSTILVGTGGTPSEAFNKFIQPTLSVLGQEIIMPYYKVLNDTYKIAILCLNNYDIPIDKNEDGTFIIPRDGECISTEQLEWFINELNTIPTDYHLIIARHSFPNENECIDDKWSQTGSLGGSAKVYEDNNIIPDIVNAWINGTSLSKSYAPISGYELCPTHNVNVDFTSRGQGNFICYLVGHSHTDRICSSTLYENQIIVGFCATTADFANNYCSDLPRVRGTRSEDAITAVTVDTTERKIRLVRFGSDITFDLIKRDITTIDY